MYKGIFSCENKIAVVTGGSGLIGVELCRALCEFGSTVYIADINNESANQLADLKGIEYLYLDISSENSIKETMAHIIKQHDRIDVLINSAYPRTEDWGTKIEDVAFKSWKENIDHHLGGYFLCCREAAELMKDKNGGSIINLASIYGSIAPDFSVYEGTDMTMPVAYSAIKNGIIGLTKYIATYYAKYNIRANTISPGGVYDNQDPAFVERYCRRTPLGRMGTPQEVVGAVVFLASDASTYITGQNLMVDGGLSAW